MTQTAAAGDLANDMAAGGAAFMMDWLAPTLVIGGIIVAAIAAAVFVRERHHRRRRNELQLRLASLESILIGLSVNAASPVIPSGDVTSTIGSGTMDDDAPRGALSTIISTLRNDLGPGLPGPDRIDLRATLFVYENLDENITPANLAADLNLSLRSLQRGLSTSMNCTPRELILAVKMREAKRLLLDEDYRVQEAARAVGFDDPFHFSRRFKGYYRLSPTEMLARVTRNVA